MVSKQDRLALTIDRLFSYGVKGTAWLSSLLLLWLVLSLTIEALPAIGTIGIKFFLDWQWVPDRSQFGALAFIWGTVYSSILALALAVPTGLAVGLLSSRGLPLVPALVRNCLRLMIDVMVILPSVVIGLWGIYNLIPLFGSSMLAAVVVLTMMIVPTIATVCRNACDDLPRSWRDSSLSLGMTLWETAFNLYVPAIRPALFSGAILALGRALGETMAVTMVIGNPTRPHPSWSLFSPATSITSLLANQFGEAIEPLHLSALAYLALVLLVITLIANSVGWYLSMLSSRRL
jgi:phosphate transport system permease protein